MDAVEKNCGGSYRVEVSGWDLGKNFFVEKTILSWEKDGWKKVLLRASLTEGTLVFVRLLGDSPGVPMTHRIERIGKNLSEQGREVELVRIRPRPCEASASQALTGME